MLNVAIYGMVYLGAALMAFNVFCFAKFTRSIMTRQVEGESDRILFIPTALLVLFLAGYIVVGLFGNPDLVIGAILLGGSIFVFIMYRLMDSITQRVIRSEHREAELMAIEESNRVKSNFLSSVSHEMRTPMNVIIGLDGIALRNPDLPAETRTQLEKIGHSARYLLGLINNILDMNRIETGELEVRNEVFSLRGVWEQLNAIAETQCEEKGLVYETSLSEGETDRFAGDSLLIKQVLLTILDNAVKYTEHPGTVSFLVDASSSDGHAVPVRFSVADTGAGISPDLVESLFDPFGCKDYSLADRYGGSGLGLTSAKGMTELMGGSISVSSEKGQGSTFMVSIPLTACEPDAPLGQGADEAGDSQAQASGAAKGEAGQAESCRYAPEDASSSLEGMRVLVVDDVEDNAEIVVDLLDLEGAEGFRAENGRVALEMFENSPEYHYDAILMDLRMPEMDGLEATRRIRALDRPDAKSVPIIALTANTFESDVRHSFDAGMNMHQPKPVDPDELYSSLRRLTNGAQHDGAQHDGAQPNGLEGSLD